SVPEPTPPAPITTAARPETREGNAPITDNPMLAGFPAMCSKDQENIRDCVTRGDKHGELVIRFEHGVPPDPMPPSIPGPARVDPEPEISGSPIVEVPLVQPEPMPQPSEAVMPMSPSVTPDAAIALPCA